MTKSGCGTPFHAFRAWSRSWTCRSHAKTSSLVEMGRSTGQEVQFTKSIRQSLTMSSHSPSKEVQMISKGTCGPKICRGGRNAGPLDERIDLELPLSGTIETDEELEKHGRGAESVDPVCLYGEVPRPNMDWVEPFLLAGARAMAVRSCLRCSKDTICNSVP